MRLIDDKTKALWRAVWAAGWIKVDDFIFLFILASVAFALPLHFFLWGIDNITILYYLLVETLVSVWWLILLVFRFGLFVLQVRADINLMPEAAAKMAISFGKQTGTAAMR
jgi:hypothetical protein